MDPDRSVLGYKGFSMEGQVAENKPSGAVGKFLKDNFPRLPIYDQLFFHYGSAVVGINAAVCGLMANNLFRKSLKVRKYFLLSCVPVSAAPCLLTGVYYQALITQPLLQGTLNCPVCAVVRSSYIGAFVGGVAPIALAGFITLQMVPSVLRAAPSESVPRAILNFMKPVFLRLKYFLLFEVVSSVLVSSRQVSIVQKVLMMDEPTEESK